MIEKTGGWVFLTEYKTHYRADIYKVGNTVVARMTTASATETLPEGDFIWATVYKVEQWFDRTAPTSTVISAQADIHWHWNASLERFMPVQ